MLTDALASISGPYQSQAYYNGTCVTDAASPLGISKGSGREPWHISPASQRWAPQKILLCLACTPSALGMPPSTRASGVHQTSQPTLIGSNCELCIASAGSLVQGCGWAYKTLRKGPCCTKLLLWGLLLAGKVYAGQGGRLEGWKQLHEDGRVSCWAAADRRERCTALPLWVSLTARGCGSE